MKTENGLTKIFINTFAHIEKTTDELVKSAEQKAYNSYADHKKELIDETDAIDLALVENDRIEQIFKSTQACWLSEPHKSIRDAWGNQLYRIGAEMKKRGYVMRLGSDGFSFNWF